MCTRTKTTYGCGCRHKSTKECHSQSCTGLTRFHFVKERDCDNCKQGERERKGRYVGELKLSNATFPITRPLLSPISTNIKASPWAPEPPRPKEEGWRSPVWRKADDAWLSTLAPKSRSAKARVPTTTEVTSDDGTIRQRAEIPRTTHKPTDGWNEGSGGLDSPAPASTNGSSMAPPMMHDNGMSATGFSQQSPATPAFTMSGQQTMRTPTIEDRRVSRSKASPSDGQLASPAFGTSPDSAGLSSKRLTWEEPATLIDNKFTPLNNFAPSTDERINEPPRQPPNPGQQQSDPKCVPSMSSNSASLYLAQHDFFESVENRPSPLLRPQQGGSQTFSLDTFSLADKPHISPGHRPYISPRLLPPQNHGLGMSQDVLTAQHGVGQNNGGPGPEIYATQPDEAYTDISQVHNRHDSTVSEIGQADQLVTPTTGIPSGWNTALFDPDFDLATIDFKDFTMPLFPQDGSDIVDLGQRRSPFLREGRLFDLPLLLGDQEILSVPDTGAQINAISVQTLKRLRGQFQSQWGSLDDVVNVANSSSTDAICQVTIHCRLAQASLVAQYYQSCVFHVFSELASGVMAIMGRAFLDAAQILTTRSYLLRERVNHLQYIPRCMSIGPLKSSGLRLPVYLDSKLITAFPDTGSEIDLISRACALLHRFDIQQLQVTDKSIVQFADGQIDTLSGKVRVKFDTFTEPVLSTRSTLSTKRDEPAPLLTPLSKRRKTSGTTYLDIASSAPPDHHRTFYVFDSLPYDVVLSQSLLHSIDAFNSHASGFTIVTPEENKKEICTVFWYRGKEYKAEETLQECQQREAARRTKVRLAREKIEKKIQKTPASDIVRRDQLRRDLGELRRQNEEETEKYNAELQALLASSPTRETRR